MDLLAFILALQAEGKTAEEVKSAVDQYLEDNPTALDQAAVEAILDGRLDDIVLAQQAQPVSEDNRIWFPTTEGETVQVPTYEEYSELKSVVGNKANLNTEDKTNLVSAINEVNGKLSEGIEAAVDDWLDAHPEATTVQDGSITFPKMGTGMNNCQIVKNIAELKTSTAPYVYVINNDSRICDLYTRHTQSHEYISEEQFSVNRGGCWYWTHSNSLSGTLHRETWGGYLRENGDVMFAMPDQGSRQSTSVNINGILDTFASYFASNDIIYGQQHTLFQEHCIPDENGNYDMDCTSFVSALIQNIKKSNSRYVLGDEADNIFSSSAIRLPSTRGKNLLYIDELLEYFAENKQLFTLSPPDNNDGSAPTLNGLQPGDLLFSCDPAATGSWQDYWDTYYGVDHVVLVLQTLPEDGKVTIAQVGGSSYPTYIQSSLSESNFGYYDEVYPGGTLRTCKISIVDLENYIGTYYHVFARPSYGLSHQSTDITDKVVCSSASTPASGSAGIGWVFPNKKLEKDKYYSVTVKGVLPRFATDKVYSYLSVAYQEPNDTTSKYYSYYPVIRQTGDGKELTCPFIIPKSANIDTITSIGIRIIKYNDEAVIKTYSVSNMALVEGMDQNAVGCEPLVFEQDANFPNTVGNSSMIRSTGVRIFLTFQTTGTTGQDVKIGKFLGFNRHSDQGSTFITGLIDSVHTVALRISPTGDVFYTTASSAVGVARFCACI